MATKSFFDVLEDQVRNDLKSEIRNEIEQEIRAQLHAPLAPVSIADRVETWLASNVEASFFPRGTQARRAYQSLGRTANHAAQAAPAPALVIEKVRLSCKSLEDLCAFELMKRHSGMRLMDAFTEDELKAAWRKAALKTHPDRLGQADLSTQAKAKAQFQQLVEAYETLRALFA